MGEYVYTLKSKLFDAVTNRLSEVHSSDEEVVTETKTVACRLPLDEFEKFCNLASVLQLTKGEFLRMIAINAVDDIIREYKINIESFGMTHAQADEFEEKVKSGEIDLDDIFSKHKVNDNE